MNIPTEKTFKEIVDEKAVQYKISIGNKLNDYKHPLKLFKDEHSRIQTELTLAYDSNLDLNVVFHKLYNDSIENKHVEHITLCQEYCKANPLINVDSELYFTTLFFLHEAALWILNQESLFEEMRQEKEIQTKERKDGEFTNTRRILATYFLIKTAGKEIRHGEEKGINKTRIAEFVHFLSSKDSNPKNLRDTQIYSRVKTLWNREDLMDIDDLSYLAKEFNDVGLYNIAQEIQQLIENKETKEK